MNGQREGDYTVHCGPRPDRVPGLQYYLGTPLWRGLGRPRFLQLRRDGKRLLISAAPDSPLDEPVNRVRKLGVTRARELGLDPTRDVVYHGHLEGGTVVVPLVAARQYSAAAFSAHRARLRLSRPQLAARLGVHRNTILSWERQGTHCSPEQHRRLAALLAAAPPHTSTSDLLTS